eukprot:Gb_12619 [translate_table: standard]
MAPKRRGRPAKAQSLPKEDEKPNSEQPPKEVSATEEDDAEEKPLAKRAKGRGRPRTNPDGDANQASQDGKDEIPVETTEPKLSSKAKNITIEHCKQCNCFKVRALKVEKALKDAVPDVDVKINPEKPRRGCFEIRDGQGSIFLSLQNMPRPFTKLKQWDLDSTISDIIVKIQ